MILAFIHQRFCNAAGDASVFPVEDASTAISADVAVNLVRLQEHLRPQGFPQTEVHGRILREIGRTSRTQRCHIRTEIEQKILAIINIIQLVLWL